MYTKMKRMAYTKVLLIMLLCICAMAGCTSKDKKTTDETNKADLKQNTMSQQANSTENTKTQLDNDNATKSNEETSNALSTDPKSSTNEYSKVSLNSEELNPYTVSKGDTLYSICKKYEATCPASVAVKTILKANNLSEKIDLKEGTKLVIPEKYLSSGVKYTIKKGDTLFSIARKYTPSLTPNEGMKKIVADNFLSSNKISIGKQLFIAASN